MKAILILPLRCLLFILSGLLLTLAAQKELSQLTQWWSILVSGCNIVTLIIVLRICKAEQISFKKLINWKKGRTKGREFLVTIIAVVAIGIGGMYLAGFIVYAKFPYLAAMMIAPIPLWLAVINIFVLPITTTIAEDGLYLGYAVNRLNSKWAAVFLPAFFYALQHSFVPLLFDWKYIFYRFLSFLPLTILFCFWYYKKRNPAPIMAGHFAINLATVFQILMTSASPELFEIMKGV